MVSRILGAAASNAGDDFHILWSMQHALRLLDPQADLVAITVEGIPETPGGAAQKDSVDVWQGVDVALFYGGGTLATANRVEIQQLKYSTAAPSRSWTVARLCASKGLSNKNSVIRRLADAYSAIRKRSSPLSPEQVVVKLISNQPIAEEVLECMFVLALNEPVLNPLESANCTKIRNACGLDPTTLAEFAASLDFSECGSPSRFDLHVRVVKAIQAVSTTDSRQSTFELRNLIYSRVLPGIHNPITKETVVGAMSFGAAEALLPCPPKLNKSRWFVDRSAIGLVANEIHKGARKICLNGEGGCGKTTALMNLIRRLPNESEMIIFDCYGGGTYLDSDGQRHLPQHAFLQLCNEISARVGAPLLIPPSGSVDYVREFRLRLEKASEIIGARSANALLVIAVDAADNSIAAATTRKPQERSFVSDFLTLSEVPENIVFIVTARTGRLSDLNVPSSYLNVPIKNFDDEELKAFVDQRQPTRSAAWRTDLFALSHGNPRVISYAFDFAEETNQDPLVYLHPGGKDLDGIFKERVNEALSKGGKQNDFDVFCAGLVVLQRPVPIQVLGCVTGLGDALVRDTANDLQPGLRILNESISFADEDFERFIEQSATRKSAEVLDRCAMYHLENHGTDAYCAEHIASTLLAAKRASELLSLAQQYPEPTAIKDPVRRREVQLHRLKLAMKVAREAGKRTKAVSVLLRGANALKTDEAVQRLLAESMDLSAEFAPTSVMKSILLDRAKVHLHGSLLCHLMRAAARNGDAIRVRSLGRQFNAWLDNLSRRKDKETGVKWKLDAKDIAAEGEALLRIYGPEKAVVSIARWRPRRLMAPVIATITDRLLLAGEIHVVENALRGRPRSDIWTCLLQVSLAQAGREIDYALLDSQIDRWVSRGWFKSAGVREEFASPNKVSGTASQLLVAAEIVVANIGMRPGARKVLETIAAPELTHRDVLFEGRSTQVDAVLRAHALLQVASGNVLEISSIVEALPREPEKGSQKDTETRERERRERERHKSLFDFLNRLVPIYNARARFLLKAKSESAEITELLDLISRYGSKTYGNRDYAATTMRDRLTLSTAELSHLSPENAKHIADTTLSRLTSTSISNFEYSALQTLALRPEIRDPILLNLLRKAQEIESANEPARTRAENIIAIARLISNMSPNDGAALFASATSTLEGVDFESVFELEMFESFAKRASTAKTYRHQRRQAASDLAVVVDECWNYLADAERFPWNEVARAMTMLDLPIALASVSRWGDEGNVDDGRLLGQVATSALGNGTINAAQVASILALIDPVDESLLKSLIDAARERSQSISSSIVEEVARRVVLGVDGDNGIDEVRLAVEMAPKEQRSPWVERGRKLLSFVDQSGTPDDERADDRNAAWPQLGSCASDVLQKMVSASMKRFSTSEEIEEFVDAVRSRNDGELEGRYISADEIMREIRRVVSVPDMQAHLDALYCLQSTKLHEAIDGIMGAVVAWTEHSPAVRYWCKKEIPALIVARLRYMVDDYSDGDNRFARFVSASRLDHDEVATSILQSIELHAERWSASSVYRLLGVLAEYLPPDECAEILFAHLASKAVRVDPRISRVDYADAPEDVDDAIGQMLFAYLADISLSKRWAAAHAIRSAARMQLRVILSIAFSGWEKSTDKVFRTPKAPLYWLAARLWLTICASRIALEAPDVLVEHKEFLMGILSDDEFPHFLCRHFVVEALTTIHKKSLINLSQAEYARFIAINQSELPTEPEGDRSYDRGFGRFDGREDRRFHFDSTDTLPYWYETPLNLFADLKGDEFLEIAEKWILDKWHADPKIWEWAKEPRRTRFERGQLATSHRHGSLPSIERFSTHLEWHAMFCVVGELLRTKRLVRRKDGEYGSLAYWQKLNGLTCSPAWLSDFRDLKPLENRLWCDPVSDENQWLIGVNVQWLLGELRTSTDGELVVASHTYGQSGERRFTYEVSSALVSPDSALALIRSLQSVRSKMDYRIPSEGEDFEINETSYKLRGWIRYPEGDVELDEADLGRRMIRGSAVLPGLGVISHLGLLADDVVVTREWTGDKPTIYFRRTLWSDDLESRHRSSAGLSSEGYRLVVSSEALKKYLTDLKMDLVVEISATRRIGEETYRDDTDKKNPTRAEYDLLVILRRDGGIECTNGSAGVWA